MRNNIGKSHYFQLMHYAICAANSGEYYGNKNQFQKRHKQIMLFLTEAIQKCNRQKEPA